MTGLRPDEIEFYETSSHSLTARYSRDKIEVCKSMHSKGTGIRVVKDGAIGFSFFANESEKEKAIERALKSAKLSPREGYSLPGSEPVTRMKQYDPKLTQLDEDDVVDLTLGVINATSENAEPSKGEITISSAEVHIWNSNGVDVEQKETLLSVFSSAKKKEAVGYDYLTTRRFEDVAHVGKEAGRWARLSAGGKPQDFEGPIILSLEVISSFFDTCVLRNFNGENVRLGKTLWKIGDMAISRTLTLTDDPTVDWAPGTASFDDEGVRAIKKELVEDGMVKQFLYDTRTANLSNTTSTGNGFRSSFASTPSVGVTNVVVSSNEKTDVMDVKKGFFVKDLMGFHNMNPVTGDFSLDVTQGFIIKNGELEKPVKGCMLVGNFFEILKDAEFDRKIESKDHFFSPKLRFNGEVISK